LNDLTLFAVDTPANHLVPQANEAAQPTLDTCGQQCSTPFAYYDLDTRLWKTYEVISLWGSIKFSETWPASGLMQSGKSYQQPRLVRHTKETGYSLWPTPTASSWGSTGHRAMLQTKVNNGTISESDKQQMTSGNGGKLNPTWVEWLMGFPIGWTDLED
jgi:hypothetical protein